MTAWRTGTTEPAATARCAPALGGGGRSCHGSAREHGAYVFVHLHPDSVTLASVAAGDSDAYLRSYASMVRAFGHPVLPSFARQRAQHMPQGVAEPAWPSASWVNWVGIDGYYYFGTDSFASVFGQTIAQIRTF